MKEMTPLARWVLLATFFGHAMSVPARMQVYQDACVALCRAENIAVNEDKVHVIPWRQFVEGRRSREADRLLGLCLERPQYSTTCRVLVKSLLEHRRCDCELIERSKFPRRIYLSQSMLNDLIQDYYEISEAVQSKLQENEENVYRLGPKGKFLPKEETMIEREASKSTTSKGIMDTNGRHDSSAVNSFESGDEDDGSNVNWSQWCMAQCYNGHGGSACDCDIIP